MKYDSAANRLYKQLNVNSNSKLFYWAVEPDNVISIESMNQGFLDSVPDTFEDHRTKKTLIIVPRLRWVEKGIVKDINTFQIHSTYSKHINSSTTDLTPFIGKHVQIISEARVFEGCSNFVDIVHIHATQYLPYPDGSVRCETLLNPDGSVEWVLDMSDGCCGFLIRLNDVKDILERIKE